MDNTICWIVRISESTSCRNTRAATSLESEGANFASMGIPLVTRVQVVNLIVRPDIDNDSGRFTMRMSDAGNTNQTGLRIFNIFSGFLTEASNL